MMSRTCGEMMREALAIKTQKEANKWFKKEVTFMKKCNPNWSMSNGWIRKSIYELLPDYEAFMVWTDKDWALQEYPKEELKKVKVELL